MKFFPFKTKELKNYKFVYKETAEKSSETQSKKVQELIKKHAEATAKCGKAQQKLQETLSQIQKNGKKNVNFDDVVKKHIIDQKYQVSPEIEIYLKQNELGQEESDRIRAALSEYAAAIRELINASRAIGEENAREEIIKIRKELDQLKSQVKSKTDTPAPEKEKKTLEETQTKEIEMLMRLSRGENALDSEAESGKTGWFEKTDTENIGEIIKNMSPGALQEFIIKNPEDARTLFTDKNGDELVVNFFGNSYLEHNIGLYDLLTPDEKYVKVVGSGGHTIGYRSELSANDKMNSRIGYKAADDGLIDSAKKVLQGRFYETNQDFLKVTTGTRIQILKNTDQEIVELQKNGKIPSEESITSSLKGKEEEYSRRNYEKYYAEKMFQNVMNGENNDAMIREVEKISPELAEKVKATFAEIKTEISQLEQQNLRSADLRNKKLKIYEEKLNGMFQKMIIESGNMPETDQEKLGAIVVSARSNIDKMKTEESAFNEKESKEFLNTKIGGFLEKSMESSNFSQEERTKIIEKVKEQLETLRKEGKTIASEDIAKMLNAAGISKDQLKGEEFATLVREYNNLTLRQSSLEVQAAKGTRAAKILEARIKNPEKYFAYKEVANGLMHDPYFKKMPPGQQEVVRRIVNGELIKIDNGTTKEDWKAVREILNNPKNTKDKRAVNFGETIDTETKIEQTTKEKFEKTEKAVITTDQRFEALVRANKEVPAVREQNKAMYKALQEGGWNGKETTAIAQNLGHFTDRHLTDDPNKPIVFTKEDIQDFQKVTSELGEKYFDKSTILAAKATADALNNNTFPTKNPNEIYDSYEKIYRNPDSIGTFQTLPPEKQAQVLGNIAENSKIPGVEFSSVTEDGEIVYTTTGSDKRTRILVDENNNKIPESFAKYPQARERFKSKSFIPAQFLAALDTGNGLQDLSILEHKARGGTSALTNLPEIIETIFPFKSDSGQLLGEQILVGIRNLGDALRETDDPKNPITGDVTFVDYLASKGILKDGSFNKSAVSGPRDAIQRELIACSNASEAEKLVDRIDEWKKSTRPETTNTAQ